MAQTFLTEAIVLRRSPIREMDRRVVLYSKHRGKITTIARGTQKITSKNAGHLEPGSIIDVMVAYSPSIEKLASAKMKESFAALRSDVVGIALLSYVLEFVDRIHHDHEPDALFYQRVVETLSALNRQFQNQPSPRKISALQCFVRITALQLLHHVGLMGSLDRCAECGDTMTGDVVLYISDRAFAHAHHEATMQHQNVGRDAYEFLLTVGSSSLSEFFDIPLMHAPLSDVTRLCDRIVESGLERPLHSAKFV